MIENQRTLSLQQNISNRVFVGWLEKIASTKYSGPLATLLGLIHSSKSSNKEDYDQRDLQYYKF